MPRPAMWLLVALLIASGMWAGEAEEARPPLRFDPFQIPDLTRLGIGNAERGEAWEPILRATLVAEGDALADLGGVVLRVDEETHGYRLVAVRAFEADFELNGEAITLPVRRAERRR